jgi:hypothetical protein
MPPFNATPGDNTPVRLALYGIDNYALGDSPKSPTTKMQITNVLATGGTATLTVTVREGNIPLVGQSLTVSATTAGSGALNGGPYTITAVSITPATGQGTIQFASGASISTTADVGTALVQQTETFEALVNGASQAFAVPRSPGADANGRTIAWQTSFGTAPSAITVAVQISNSNIDGEYATMDTSISTSGEIRYLSGFDASFVRFLVSGLSGSSPTGAIKFRI